MTTDADAIDALPPADQADVAGTVAGMEEQDPLSPFTNERIALIKQQTKASIENANTMIADQVAAMQRRTLSTGGRGFGAAYRGDLQETQAAGQAEMARNIREGAIQEMGLVSQALLDESMLSFEREKWGQTYQLELDRFEQSRYEFGESLGLEREKVDLLGKQFSESIRQFDLQYGLDEQQVGLMQSQLEAQVNQWGAENGIEESRLQIIRDQVLEETRQFNLQYGLNEREMAVLEQRIINDMIIAEGQLAIEREQIDISREQLSAQIRQWGAANGLDQQRITSLNTQIANQADQFAQSLLFQQLTLETETGLDQQRIDALNEQVELDRQKLDAQVQQWGEQNGLDQERVNQLKRQIALQQADMLNNYNLARDQLAVQREQMDQQQLQFEANLQLENRGINLQGLDMVLRNLAAGSPDAFMSVMGSIMTPILDSLQIPGLDAAEVKSDMLASMAVPIRVEILFDQGVSDQEIQSRIETEFGPEMPGYDWERLWELNPIDEWRTKYEKDKLEEEGSATAVTTTVGAVTYGTFSLAASSLTGPRSIRGWSSEDDAALVQWVSEHLVDYNRGDPDERERFVDAVTGWASARGLASTPSSWNSLVSDLF